MSRFWSQHVHELQPYTPGEQPKLDKLVKLNTNENPYGPSPMVVKAIAEANGESLRKYPDPTAQQLKQTIADYYQLERNQVFVGNSSDEVLGHIFHALFKQTNPLLFPDITYSFYPVYCGLYEIEYKQIPLADDFTIDLQAYPSENGGVIFANPNAPTGIALDIKAIEQFLQANRDSVVVVDEAYVDFGGKSAVALIGKYPNLLVTQTLSKSRSLAGLRVGLGLGNKELIEALERVKNSFHPYALGSLALAGAQAAFKDQAYFEETTNKVIATREETCETLRGMGFEILPSSANFVFVRHLDYAARELFQNLREHSIVTRYFDKQRIDEYLRISIGTDAEMQRMLEVVEKLLKNG
ncbi:MAG: histidinol-phosphate transaminase [Pseudomonadota bacterium]